MFDGIAKPMPMLPPDSERICELMPTSSPFVFTSAPPELPWLIGASVWRKSSNPPSPTPVDRPFALMIPKDPAEEVAVRHLESRRRHLGLPCGPNRHDGRRDDVDDVRVRVAPARDGMRDGRDGLIGALRVRGCLLAVRGADVPCRSCR